MKRPSHTTKLILAFGVIYLIWGSTFFAVHLGLKSFPPFLFSALRLLIAGVALAAFCIVRAESKPSLAEISKHTVTGLVIFIGGIVAVVWAQQFISSSLASSIVTTPFWFVVLDRQQWKFYFSSRWIPAGLLMGLMGVILLMAFRESGPGTGTPLMQTMSVAIIIFGSLFWAGGSLYLKYRPSQASAFVTNTIQFLAAGIFCLILSWATGEWQNFSTRAVTTGSLMALLYLGIVSSLIGFLSFMWLIKVQPPAMVSTYSYVNPLVATFLGWAFAGEHISGIQLGGLAVILFGVLLVNVPRYKGLVR